MPEIIQILKQWKENSSELTETVAIDTNEQETPKSLEQRVEVLEKELLRLTAILEKNGIKT